MNELRNFYNERKLETEEFISLLNKLDNIAEYSNEMSILKSQAILMMYNLIEGTVNRGLEYIFDKINDANLKHNQVSKDIMIMWFKYFKLDLDDEGQHKEQLDKFINNCIDIDIKKFRKINPSYFSGGSLDSDAIIKILKKFTIVLSIGEYKLREIKNDRNFLAHGEKSFTEVSQSKTVSSIKENQAKVFIFLESYIFEIEKYIDEVKYKET